MAEPMTQHEENSPHQKPHLPRITITYCTQCKWMLRAAYFAQELLSTFGTSLGEVVLRPATGGIFTVTIVSDTSNETTSSGTEEKVLWDRKTHGGFPEVKQLKASVRNIIDPSRDLGHVDRALNKASKPEENGPNNQAQIIAEPEGGASQNNQFDKSLRTEQKCEDCQ